MRDLILALLSRLDAGEDAVLVRVIETSGSAPRGPGASMVVDGGGRAFGTVGGGTVEHRSIAEAAEVLKAGGHLVRDFALRNAEAADLGMVCGGDMRLLFQRVEPACAPLFREALRHIEAHQARHLATDLSTGEMRLTGRADEPGCFCQPLLAPGISYVFGGGHVAVALAPLLAQMGFRVVVLDDRSEFIDAARFPGAEARLIDFAHLELSVAPDDDIVIMTRGHEHDLRVLAQMLRTQARYIGMMGSSSKRAFVYAELRKQGFTEADIGRVRSPIGLPIGAETPLEIAVSIAAEMVRVRADSRAAASR